MAKPARPQVMEYRADLVPPRSGDCALTQFYFITHQVSNTRDNIPYISHCKGPSVAGREKRRPADRRDGERRRLGPGRTAGGLVQIESPRQAQSAHAMANRKPDGISPYRHGQNTAFFSAGWLRAQRRQSVPSCALRWRFLKAIRSVVWPGVSPSIRRSCAGFRLGGSGKRHSFFLISGQPLFPIDRVVIGGKLLDALFGQVV